MQNDIKQRRLALGLTQAQLAGFAGLPYSTTVSNAEHGRSCSPAHRAMIAEALDRQERILRGDPEIDARRKFLAAIPPSPELDAFVTALVDRAWHLLDGGEAQVFAADALLEFLPADASKAVLDAFFEYEAQEPPAISLREHECETEGGIG